MNQKRPSFGNQLEERIVKQVYAKETLERVGKALDALRDESKQILIAVYVDDLSAWEICERLGCESAVSYQETQKLKMSLQTRLKRVVHGGKILHKIQMSVIGWYSKWSDLMPGIVK